MTLITTLLFLHHHTHWPLMMMMMMNLFYFSVKAFCLFVCSSSAKKKRSERERENIPSCARVKIFFLFFVSSTKCLAAFFFDQLIMIYEIYISWFIIHFHHFSQSVFLFFSLSCVYCCIMVAAAGNSPYGLTPSSQNSSIMSPPPPPSSSQDGWSLNGDYSSAQVGCFYLIDWFIDFWKMIESLINQFFFVGFWFQISILFIIFDDDLGCNGIQSAWCK